MTAYPQVVKLVKRIVAIEQRVRRLEAQMTTVRGTPDSGSGQLDGNRLTNGGFESGTTGWQATFNVSGNGDSSTRTADQSNPIDGQVSMLVSEPAKHWTLMGWQPNPGNPQDGIDVFDTVAGDQWRLTGIVRPNYTPENGNLSPTLYLIVAVSPDYVFRNQDGTNNKWITVASLSAASGQAVSLDGTATVPSGFTYAGFMVTADNGNAYPRNAAWSWSVDDCAMRKVLS